MHVVYNFLYMEVLELDGKQYVKASKAARDAGYTSDYVGQLCRSGAVPAHLVGRSWYVDTDYLSKHRVDKKRSSRIKAREQIRKALDERRLEVGIVEKHNVSDGIRHITPTQVSYTDDVGTLIPEVRKLEVSEAPVAKKTSKNQAISSEKKEAAYTIENEGEKIVMTGALTVVDVTDDPSPDNATVLLTPKISKIVRSPEKAIKKLKVETVTSEEDVGMSVVRTNFEERLSEEPQEPSETATDEVTLTGELKVELAEDGEEQEPTPETKQSKGGHTVLIMGTLSVLCAVSLLFLEVRWTYSHSEPGHIPDDIDVSYYLSAEQFLAKMPFKI